MQKKVTIKDIAKMADVSPGTVDRVIHNRGKVSADKKKKIDAVLKKINYQPNLIAKTLKNNRVYQISVLIPDPSKDEYWQKVEWGVHEGLNEFLSFGIRVSVHHYDPSLFGAFENAFEVILSEEPDGVLMAPLDTQPAMEVIRRCRISDLPFMIFNSPIKEADPLTFIGQDLYKSGRLTAELIHLTKRHDGKIAILHIDESPANSPHTFEKERGIKDYLNEKGYLSHNILSIELFHQESEDILSSLEDIINEQQPVCGFIISTSKSYEVAGFLRSRNPDSVIVGYDLISKNTPLLESGDITFLINQSPIQQAYLGIQRFTDHFIFGKEIPKEELLPLQIVTRENLNSILIQRFGSVRL